MKSKDQQLLAEAYSKVLKEDESIEALKAKIKELEKAREEAYYGDEKQELVIGNQIHKLKKKLEKLKTESIDQWHQAQTDKEAAADPLLKIYNAIKGGEWTFNDFKDFVSVIRNEAKIAAGE